MLREPRINNQYDSRDSGAIAHTYEGGDAKRGSSDTNRTENRARGARNRGKSFTTTTTTAKGQREPGNQDRNGDANGGENRKTSTDGREPRRGRDTHTSSPR